MGFPLTADQRLAVENTGGPLLVSAAAGAGKTRVLVERLLDRVEKGADVDEFLIITFTNAAAAELRQRVAEELSVRLAQWPSDRHLRRQMNLVYSAHISTIDAFCKEFLRSWGHLVDLDPDFRLCDSGEGDVLLGEALEEVLERRYEAVDPAFACLLDLFAQGRDDRAVGEMAVRIYEKLRSHPKPGEWLNAQRRAYGLDGVTDAAQTPWGSYLLGRYRTLAEYWLRRLEPLAEECAAGVPAYCPSLHTTVEGLKQLSQATCWDQAAPPDFPPFGKRGKADDVDLSERAKALRNRCKARMEDGLLGRGSAGLLAELREVSPAAVSLLDLVEELGDAYAREKTRRGVLDFSDLEHLTLRVLEDYPQVAREVSERLVEVMVDEYQDTNGVQNAIFDRLTAQRGNLFMVGDVKQSIYRFRMADPTIFLEKYRRYPHAADAAEGQGRRVILGENFRSRREVIDCVNFLFGNLMTETMGELNYGPEESLRPGGEKPPRDDCTAELHLIANPKEGEEGEDTMAEPRLVARRLARLMEEGFQVEDGKGGTRPVRPGDMVILLRSPSASLSRYVRALYEAGLPWAGGGGEAFLETPEVAVALSYLEIVDNPRQDVPLIGVLRSPLYGFTPDQLARLKERKGEGCFYDALREDDDPRSAAFLADLEELRLLSRDRKSYEVLWDIYCGKGLLPMYPEERRRGLLELYHWARKFEDNGHKGLFGFLTQLRRRREQGDKSLTAAAPGGEGVAILSIHKSKGLEYPVVAVAGLGKGFNHTDSKANMLFHRDLGLGPKGLDQARMIRYPTLARWAVAEKLEEELCGEELRLLYVALTRAREKLILTCALRDPEKEVAALLDQAALPPEPEGLRQMDSMGYWILAAALCRPEAAPLRQGMALSQAPPAGAEFGLPWRMELHSGEEYRTARRVLGKTAPETLKPLGPLPDYTWKYPHAAATALPSKITATQLKGRAIDQEAEEGTPAQARRPVQVRRPDFAEEKGLTPGERGTAHHVVMQFLDFSQTDSVEAIQADIRRLVDKGIVAKRQGDAVDPQVILDFFRSSLGREVIAAGEGLHREFKFSLLEPASRYFPEMFGEPGEAVLLQGVVDCWFDTPQGLVIVDFKSDRVSREDLQARAEGYRLQIEAYASALSQMLGRPVARRVLWFFAQSCAVTI